MFIAHTVLTEQTQASSSSKSLGRRHSSLPLHNSHRPSGPRPENEKSSYQGHSVATLLSCNRSFLDFDSRRKHGRSVHDRTLTCPSSSFALFLSLVVLLSLEPSDVDLTDPSSMDWSAIAFTAKMRFLRVILLARLILFASALPTSPILTSIDKLLPPAAQEAKPFESQRVYHQRETRRQPVKVYLRTPYPLRDPDALPAVTTGNLRPGLNDWLQSWKTASHSTRSPPSTNKDMQRLLNSRPYRVFRSAELLAITATTLHANEQQVVQLPGGPLDKEVLTMMTRKGRSFYIQGGRGKVWHFEKSGPNSFTYTDRIRRGDLFGVQQALYGKPASAQRWWQKLLRDARQKLGKGVSSFDSVRAPDCHSSSKVSFY